jgi:hypothetical protein
MSSPADLQQKIDTARHVSLGCRIAKARQVRKAAPPMPPPPAPAPGGEAPPAPTKRTEFKGIPLEIDRPAGYVQQGVDEKGQAWSRTYHVDYGFIPGTKGGDGEGLDVFVGRALDATEAFWITQLKADGTFDEFKLMLGFVSADSAKAMWLAHVPKKFFGGISATSIEAVKALLGIEPAELVKALAGFELRVPGGGWLGAQMASALGKGEADFRETHAAATGEGRTHTVAIAAAVTKAAPDGAELRYVLCAVLVPEEVDAQGDIYSADEIRKAAWGFVRNSRNIGLNHQGVVGPDRAAMVESFVTPVDVEVEGTLFKAGTWIMGIQIDDNALWAKVKSGELTGLSIGGWAKKNPIEE